MVAFQVVSSRSVILGIFQRRIINYKTKYKYWIIITTNINLIQNPFIFENTREFAFLNYGKWTSLAEWWVGGVGPDFNLQTQMLYPNEVTLSTSLLWHLFCFLTQKKTFVLFFTFLFQRKRAILTFIQRIGHGLPQMEDEKDWLYSFCLGELMKRNNSPTIQSLMLMIGWGHPSRLHVNFNLIRYQLSMYTVLHHSPYFNILVSALFIW